MDPQARKVARPQLAINYQIEHRQLTNVRRHLKPRPDRPDFPKRLLSGELAFVPRHAVDNHDILGFHGNLLSIEWRLSVRRVGRSQPDPHQTIGRPPGDDRFQIGSDIRSR